MFSSSSSSSSFHVDDATMDRLIEILTNKTCYFRRRLDHMNNRILLYVIEKAIQPVNIKSYAYGFVCMRLRIHFFFFYYYSNN